jgi:outer membrane murein-binding lipoprotein Lpp
MGLLLIQSLKITIMAKTIYIIDPTTRELLGTAESPLDPVASEQAGKLVYAEVNSDNATEIKPPEHDKAADDVRWLGAHGWQVERGGKAKRAEAQAAAATEAEAQTKVEQLKAQLAAMTETERKLHSLREEDPAGFDADEAEEAQQVREAQALERLNRHEKRREKRRADKAKENNGNGGGNNSNNKKQVNNAK